MAGTKDWRIENNPSWPSGDKLLSGRAYRLHNLTFKGRVAYGERKYGINLVWTKNVIGKFALQTERRREDGTVLWGERVAIRFLGGGSWVRHQTRDYGINLGWSSTPIYEWEFHGDAAGDPISMPMNNMGLYNRRAKDYVVYCERPYGINLRWSRDCEKQNGDISDKARVNVNCRIPLEGVGQDNSFGSVQFAGQLITPRGASGLTTFSMVDQWEAGPSADYGLASVQASGLKPGLWRMQARTVFWGSSCDVELTRGNNLWVNFHENRHGCARGVSFPRMGAGVTGLESGRSVDNNSVILEDTRLENMAPMPHIDEVGDDTVLQNVPSKTEIMAQNRSDIGIDPVTFPPSATSNDPI